jgi:predicted permease
VLSDAEKLPNADWRLPNEMKTLRTMLVRFVGLFRRKQHEAEMNEELGAHLDGLIERNVATGMSPEEARFAALRAFGGVAQIEERARDERRSAWGEHLSQDLRYAFRQMRKNPGFTATVVLTLALGIGANAAIFSLLDEVVLKPLPARNPSELVLFEWRSGSHFNGFGGGPGSRDPSTQERIGRGFSRFAFDQFRKHEQTIVDLFAFRPLKLDVSVGGVTEETFEAQLVSGGYFDVVNVAASLGRTLDRTDDRSGAPPAVVISHRYWWRRFGGDTSVIGKAIRVNNTSATVVGVLPPSFHGTMGRGRTNEIFLPLALSPQLVPEDSNWWSLWIMGRLKSGATLETVRSEFAGAFHAAARDGLQNHPQKEHWETSPAFPRLQIRPGAHGYVARDPWSLLTLQGLAGLLLLVACFNVANLLLARSVARQREIAVRLALGASRARVVRQLLTESVLLALCGAALGTLLAWWGKDLLLAMHPMGTNGSVFAPQLDGRILAFTAALTVVTSVFFGLAPALRATRLDLTAQFQRGTRSFDGGSPSVLRLARVLMVAQVALSLVLLIGAGLFVRTLQNLHTADVGFDREQLIAFRIDPRPAGYRREQFMSLHERIAAHIETLPGVRSAAFSDSAVLAGGNAYLDRISVPGYSVPSTENPDEAAVMRFTVGPKFLATYKIPIVRGRDFNTGDDKTAPKVALIDQRMARKYFGEEDPIGRHFTLGSRSDAALIEVVGIVAETKSIDLRRQTPPTFYLSALQRDALSSAHFAVRTIGDPTLLVASIRKAVAEIDRTVPLLELRTQDEEVETLVMHERFFARLSGFFSVLALGLICIGLYGLMSYSAQRRTGEIGLRMALGAVPRSVLWMMLRESLVLVFVGVCVGFAGAAAVTRLVAAMLYELSPTDPFTYGGAGLLLIAVALLACWLPARRAAKVDPMVALRAE